MGFPAVLAPAAPWAVFPHSLHRVPLPVHPGPSVEPRAGPRLLLWLDFLICQACLIKHSFV